jgi:hypothetical protein
MSKQIINIGSAPNSKNGDSIRDAFNKVNANFNELYANTVNSGANVTESATPPSSPTAGNLWYDTVGGRMYVYFDSGWVDTNPMPATTDIINRYVSTANSDYATAVVISTASTKVFLAPLSGGNASYKIGNGLRDGQQIQFFPSWKTGTNDNDVRNIFVYSDRLYNTSTGTAGRYSTTPYPWYVFTSVFNNGQTMPTLTWDAVGGYWIPYPYNYD